MKSIKKVVLLLEKRSPDPIFYGKMHGAFGIHQMIFLQVSQLSLPGGFDEARSDGSFGYATHISEVNVFFPSQPSISICSKLSPVY